MRKHLIAIIIALASCFIMQAQTYVGTMTIGHYTQQNVRVQLTDNKAGSATLLLQKVKFARMMPVKLDVQISPVKHTQNRLQADGVVPTAKGKSYEKYTVHRLEGTADGTLRFQCQLGEKLLQFEGKRASR